MNDICGMLPFGDPDKPDQFYRLFTSIFLHAGWVLKLPFCDGELSANYDECPSVSASPYYYWYYILRYFRLLQLLVTIIYNLFILRPVEIMIGWIRTVVIFFGSGIAGSLASAIFLPYLVSVSKYLFLQIGSCFNCTVVKMLCRVSSHKTTWPCK